jgi:hypothetical protein
MDGYYAGLNACSSRGSNGGGGFEQPSQPPSSQRDGIDWLAACGLAHTFLGLQTPCNELVNPDNTLTDQGNKVLLCYGGGLLLAIESGGLSALGSEQLARAAGCPK